MAVSEEGRRKINLFLAEEPEHELTLKLASRSGTLKELAKQIGVSLSDLKNYIANLAHGPPRKR